MSNSPPTLPTLKYATSVARLGSFSAAARECGVSQPTVSNAVADLEDALGARLFERSTRKLSLTPAGERLLPLASSVLGAVADLEREAELLKRPTQKLLRVGFSPLLGAQRVGLFIEPFRTQRPDVEIVYKECTLSDMEARLDAGTVDVICGTYFTPNKRGRSRQALCREELRWVPPTGSSSRRPSRGSSITLHEAAQSRILLTVDICGLASTTRGLFAKAGLPIKEYAGHAMSYAVLEEWADLGIGGAVLPASNIRSPARSAALVHEKKPLHISYEAVWKKEPVTDHMKELAKYLRTVVPRIAAGIAGYRASA